MERTFPSSVLRTQPTSPSALAFFCVNQRKLTPENPNCQQCYLVSQGTGERDEALLICTIDQRYIL